MGKKSQLELFLLQANGKAGSALLEDLLTLAGGKGNANRITGIMSLADGNILELQRLTDAAKNFKNLSPPSPIWLPKWRYVQADGVHFLERHTWDFFDFNDITNIKGSQGIWPVGTQPSIIMKYLEEALDLLKAKGKLPKGWKTETVTLSNGITVQVGTQPIAGSKNMIIGQFFPVNGPGVISLYKDEMLAIRPIFIP